MIRHKTNNRALRRIRLLSLLLLLSLVACGGGPRVIKGEPPFVRITALALSEQELDIEFSLRNLNSVPLHIDFIRFQLNIGENAQVNHETGIDANIVANGSERLSFRIAVPPEEARAHLEKLESGDIVSLPYELEGRIHELEAGNLSFSNDGHLYTVPGRPGQFR
jgi:hypothetical protein